MRSAALRLAGTAVLAVGWWALYLKFSFVGFMGDPLYYLEPARNVAAGLGSVTRILYPAQVAMYPEGLTLPAPFLWHGPLSPLLIGFLYKVFGMSDCVPLVFSFASTLAIGLLMYRFAHKLGGERPALLAAALFWTSYTVMDANVSSVTDGLFNLLVAGGCAFLWESSGRKRPELLLFAAGLCLGLASLSRLAYQVYAVGFIAAAVWLHPRSWKAPALILFGLGLGLLPLAAYNHTAAGFFFLSPGYYILKYSRSFPGVSAQTSYMTLSSFGAVLAYPLDVLQKMVTGPLYGVNKFIEGAFHPYMMASVFFGLLANYGENKAAGRFRTFAVIVSLPVFLVNLVMSNGDVRYLHPVYPLLLVVAAVYLFRFIDANARWLGRWPWGLAVFGLLFVSPSALVIKDLWKTRPQRAALYRDLESLGAFLKERTKAHEVLYSDDAPTILAHADRPTVLLTKTLADAEKTFRHLPPDALVFTSLRIKSSDYDPAFEKAFREKRGILGFEPCAYFQSARVSAALYRRPGACKAAQR